MRLPARPVEATHRRERRRRRNLLLAPRIDVRGRRFSGWRSLRFFVSLAPYSSCMQLRNQPVSLMIFDAVSWSFCQARASLINRPVHDIFELLLLSAHMLRVNATSKRIDSERLQRVTAREDLAAKFRVPARITLGLELGELVVFDQRGCPFKRDGYHVDCAYMPKEQVLGRHALTAHFRIEVHAASAEAAMSQDFIQRQRQLFNAVRKLVGVPAILRIAAIRIDTAEDAERVSRRNLVVE